MAGRARPRLAYRRILSPSRLHGRTDAAGGAYRRQQGRTVEIQRLIGRSVRAVADMEALGERTL